MGICPNDPPILFVFGMGWIYGMERWLKVVRGKNGIVQSYLEKTRPSILGLYPCQSAIYGDTASWGQERQGGLAVYKQEAGIPGSRLYHF